MQQSVFSIYLVYIKELTNETFYICIITFNQQLCIQCS